MAIEPTILNEFPTLPEQASDAANPRGLQDFSRFLNAVTPDAPGGAGLTDAAVGNPTPETRPAPATPASGPGAEIDGDPSNPLEAVLMMADQLGLDTRPATQVSQQPPLRSLTGEAQQPPVAFETMEAAAGALPESLPQAPKPGDGAKDDAEGEIRTQQWVGADPALPPAVQPAVAAVPPAPVEGMGVKSPATEPRPATDHPVRAAAVAPQAVAAIDPADALPPTTATATGAGALAHAVVSPAGVGTDHRPIHPRGDEGAVPPIAARARDLLETLSGIATPLPDPDGTGPDRASSTKTQPDPALPADPGLSTTMPAPPTVAVQLQPPAGAAALAPSAAPPPAQAPQQLLEDLLVGNAVEDQWIDRLSRDVQALVASDNREARLHLRPRELGDLAIRLNLADGQAKVHFTAETAAAQALIADAMPRLQAMMEHKGLRLDQASVDLGGQGASAGRNGGGAAQDGQQPNGHGLMSNASPRAVAAVARAVARQTAFERYA